MEITWFNEKPKDLVVTLAKGNLTLNKPATTFFENAYSVMLGYNRDDGLIFIKPLDKALALRHDTPDGNKYRITVKSSYSRITNKAFMDEVSEFAGIDLSDDTKKYKANWNEKDQILIVDLKEEV
jgi:hypothetical protein